jgi:Trypsin-like peptidase domain
MPEPEENPTLGGVLTRRYRATLVAAALLILVVGFALRPKDPDSKTAPPPSQSEMRRLQRLAERQSLESMTEHFAGLAQEVAVHLVAVGPPPSTGTVWSAGLVVTGAGVEPTAASTSVSTPTNQPLAATRVAGGPGLPLAALEVAGPLEPVALRDSSIPDPPPGQWLVAVWRGAEGHLFKPGHFLEFRPTRCGELAARELASSLELAEPMEGGGLFDLDGDLMAVVLPCDGRSAALSVESVNLGLVQGRSPEGRLRTLYGMRVVPVDEAMKTYAGVGSGVVVNEIWTGFAADLRGLLPGDVIASVDGNPVNTPDDLQPLLAPTARAEPVLGVWRARQKREVRLLASAPDGPPSGEASAGLRLAPPEEGFRIGTVAPGGPAARGAVHEGDQLLRVNFAVPRTRAEVDRALSRPGPPAFVEVRRGTRRFGFLLESR